MTERKGNVGDGGNIVLIAEVVKQLCKFTEIHRADHLNRMNSTYKNYTSINK